MADYGSSNHGGTGGNWCCVTFILISFSSLFTWLILSTSNPVLSIQDVYIPALNQTLNSTSYQPVYIDLKLDNKNSDKGIYYKQLNITLHYYLNQSNSNHKIKIPISNYTLRGFYQGHEKYTRRKNWTETYGLPLNGAVFRLDLETVIRFKILLWKTKRHRLVVGADFEVSDRGQKVKKKGTRLKSGVREMFSGQSPVILLLVVFSTLVLALS